MLERLRLVNRHPMGLQRSYLPARIGEELLRADLAETPLRQALEFKLGLVVARARETVAAVRLGRREARDLGCRPGAPAFKSERISLTAAGEPIVFDRVFIPGDRFRITRELTYPAPGQPPATATAVAEDGPGPDRPGGATA
jgi:GntR family transcriptional regulator